MCSVGEIIFDLIGFIIPWIRVPCRVRRKYDDYKTPLQRRFFFQGFLPPVGPLRTTKPKEMDLDQGWPTREQRIERST
ncbi:hypothetical protein HZH68_012130 [Vespula germanica]|uniref:Uncharacterized protein n=1 Tax=Vespula germanica TaxID=30212 RepID=A0A834N120_VESGE|nr:hypothetical protein HZH68_012130 [Vespula germanica]